MTDFYKKVAKIQNELKAPKNQVNKFGGYNYRSCEDILEAVKKVKGDLVVTISDQIEAIADRIYVKATATITDGKESLSNTAYAREALSKKGMDDSQLTGSCSSYARKYALNGLFCIDDTKDADTQDNTQQPAVKTITKKQAEILEQMLSLHDKLPAIVKNAYSINSVSDLPADKFKECELRINKFLGAQNGNN